MADAPEAKPSDDSLEKGADRLRASAKWLIAAFGAVAAVIFAGLTASNLGALHAHTPGHRLSIALAGAAASILGIAYALSAAMRLAGASTTSVRDLTRTTKRWEWSLIDAREEVKADPALKAWDGDVASFVADHESAYEQYVRWADAYARDPSTKPNPAQLNKAVYRLGVMTGIARRVLLTTSFLRLQYAFVRARIRIAAAMVIAAAGAVAFAWATTTVPPAPPELGVRPSAGVLQPADDTLKVLNRQLPAACQLKLGDSVSVVVLGQDDTKKTLRVVTLPKETCPPTNAPDVPIAEVTRP